MTAKTVEKEIIELLKKADKKTKEKLLLILKWEAAKNNKAS